MACFVYVLGAGERDASGLETGASYRTYVGWTVDVERRLAQHNAGVGAKSTRGRRWTLLHVERFKTRPEAMAREWRLKRDRPFRKRLAEAGRAGLTAPPGSENCGGAGPQVPQKVL